jgi:lincosamide nucleotidyltransferase
MNKIEYEAFTRQLTHNLTQDARVLGLVALGSMAQKSHLADEWSDHDFFVIVETGHQQAFRQQRDWLPQADSIVFSYRETEHGVKVFYAFGHLLEFAVFDAMELRLAKVNDYLVLYDRDSSIAPILAALEQRTTQNSPPPDDHYLFGQLLGHVLVGAGRYARGEKISGHVFIKHYAITDALALLAKHLEAVDKTWLDTLDPLRRFEAVYPALGAEINALLAQQTPAAGRALLQLVEREFKDRLAAFPAAALAMVYQYLDTVQFNA